MSYFLIKKQATGCWGLVLRYEAACRGMGGRGCRPPGCHRRDWGDLLPLPSRPRRLTQVRCPSVWHFFSIRPSALSIPLSQGHREWARCTASEARGSPSSPGLPDFVFSGLSLEACVLAPGPCRGTGVTMSPSLPSRRQALHRPWARLSLGCLCACSVPRARSRFPVSLLRPSAAGVDRRGPHLRLCGRRRVAFASCFVAQPRRTRRTWHSIIYARG